MTALPQGVAVVAAPFVEAERDPSANPAPDRDGDGCPDSEDAFPANPNRCLATDIDTGGADASAYDPDGKSSGVDDGTNADCPESPGGGGAMGPLSSSPCWLPVAVALLSGGCIAT